jgi:hypothetical protein
VSASFRRKELEARTYKPLINQMIIPLNDESGVVEKVIDNLTIAPSTILVEESQRRIPMKEHWGDLEALLHQLSNNTIVVFNAFLVDRTFAERKDARPRDGEAESRHAQVLQASKVLFVKVVVRCGDVGGGVVCDLVDDAVAEEVPDRWAFAFGVDGALLGISNARLFPYSSTRLTSIWKAEEATPQEKPSGSEAVLKFCS